MVIGALEEVRAVVDALAWLLDYRDEIRSDLSVFHRIDDMDSMPAPRFWSFATRLPFYDGAMRASIRAAMVDRPPVSAAPAVSPAPELEVWQMTPKPPPGAEVIAPGGAAAMLASYGSAHVSHSKAPLA